MKNYAFALLAIILLVSTVSSAKEVSWYSGTAEQAVEEAKAKHQMLFFYWGASWCPPCNVLKAGAFKDPQFVEATQNFISVYLDGDQKEAQKWSDKLSVGGYPTLLIVNEKLEEVSRFAPGLTTEQLTAQMNQVYRNSRSIKQILQATLSADSQKVPSDDWKILAKNQWETDEQWSKQKEEMIKNLEQLVQKVPADLKSEKTAFQLSLLIMRIKNLKEGATLSASEKEEGKKLLADILSSPQAMENHFVMLTSYPEDFAKNLYSTKEFRGVLLQFIAQYRRALWPLLDKKTRTLTERLDVVSAIVNLSSSNNAAFSELTKKEKIKAAKITEDSLHQAKTHQEKIFVLSYLSDIYKKLGESEKAEKILTQNLKTVGPGAINYVYTMLGEIALDQGRLEDAVNLSRKAYENTQGTATRMQWGKDYIAMLLNVSPTRTDLIWSETKKILGQGLETSDGFSGRNKGALNKLRKQIAGWAKEFSPKVNFQDLQALQNEKCQNRDSDFSEKCAAYFKEFNSLLATTEIR